MRQAGNGTAPSMYGLEGKKIRKKKQVITQCFLLEQLLELDREIVVFSSSSYKHNIGKTVFPCIVL